MVRAYSAALEACADLEEAQGVVPLHLACHGRRWQMCTAGWRAIEGVGELKEALGELSRRSANEICSGVANAENGTNSSGFNAGPHGYFDLNGLKGVAKDITFGLDESNEQNVV